MLTEIPQSLILFLTGLVYYTVDFSLMRYYGRRAHDSDARSWRYTALMVAFWVLLVLQPVLLPMLGLSTGAWWGLAIQAVGVGLILAALALHWWARSHLKHFYVEDVRFQDGQHLVDTGPYSRVRHPVFTSFFLIAIGMLLVCPAVTTLIMLLYVSVDFPRAARQEEELLLEKLPDYADYMGRTGRFSPRRRE